MKDNTKKELLGELAIITACIFLAVNAVIAKELTKQFSGIFLSFIQFASGMVFVFISLGITGKKPKVNSVKLWLLRGLSGLLTIVLYYIAIKISSSGRASLLANTFPVFVFISGFLFFHEKITAKNIISLIFCVAGVFFVMYDGSNYGLLGDFLALLSGISAAFGVHIVKKLRKTDDVFITYLSVCLFGLLLFPLTLGDLKMITIPSLFPLILIGFLLFAAQILNNYGIKFVSATKASVTSYVRIPFTVLLSYFIIREQITIRFILGIILILGGLLLNSMLIKYFKKSDQKGINSKNVL